MELIPRISRAQSMDVLSSQSTIAGYRAVTVAAELLPRIFPMLVTAAGTLQPTMPYAQLAASCVVAKETSSPPLAKVWQIPIGFGKCVWDTAVRFGGVNTRIIARDWIRNTRR